jgi:hypothetical protein
VNDELAQQFASPDHRDPDGQGLPPPFPDPAREALDEPPLTAEELEREIGDSEAWDEASEGTEEKI